MSSKRDEIRKKIDKLSNELKNNENQLSRLGIVGEIGRLNKQLNSLKDEEPVIQPKKEVKEEKVVETKVEEKIPETKVEEEKKEEVKEDINRGKVAEPGSNLPKEERKDNKNQHNRK